MHSAAGIAATMTAIGKTVTGEIEKEETETGATVTAAIGEAALLTDGRTPKMNGAISPSGSGALGVLGLLSRDNTLTFAGSAGALYSLYRYEEDRKSQNRLNRARAAYFSRPYFYRDGERFERVIVTRNGKRFYRFVRG